MDPRRKAKRRIIVALAAAATLAAGGGSVAVATAVSTEANASTELRQRIVAIAHEELKAGVKESDGSCNKYFKDTGSPWKCASTPWCAAFTSWVYMKAGATNIPETNRYLAASWAKSKHFEKRSKARKGDEGSVVTFWSGSRVNHVGIVVKVYDDGSYDTIDGNSGRATDRVDLDSHVRNGYGFYAPVGKGTPPTSPKPPTQPPGHPPTGKPTSPPTGKPPTGKPTSSPTTGPTVSPTAAPSPTEAPPAPPGPGLPVTGTSSLAIGGVGLGLLAAGGGLLVALRLRRKRTQPYVGPS